jgi:hypothetical protein
MWRIYGGAALFLAGVSAFIADFRNRPESVLRVHGVHAELLAGLTPTAYDLIHVAGWALIIAGVLLMIMGLIRYSAAARA